MAIRLTSQRPRLWETYDPTEEGITAHNAVSDPHVDYMREPTPNVTEGANAKSGTAVLAAGTVAVANTSVTVNSRIQLTCNVPGGTVGFLRVSARTAGTSFTILSSSGTDTSTVAYLIVEPV